jgi:hypothetical protein
MTATQLQLTGRTLHRSRGATTYEIAIPLGRPDPFAAPALGQDHPADHATGTWWPCPHCRTATSGHWYLHRDTCPANTIGPVPLHPRDCRCGWCTHAITRRACPGAGDRTRCGAGAHTQGPDNDTTWCRHCGPATKENH